MKKENSSYFFGKRIALLAENLVLLILGDFALLATG
jgi:hypothetical protein